MITTTLFAEILIVGLQASIWMGLIAATVLRLSLGDVLDRLAGISGAGIILLLAVAYVAGIIVDRFADSLGAKLRRFGGGRKRVLRLSDQPILRVSPGTGLRLDCQLQCGWHCRRHSEELHYGQRSTSLS